MSQLLRYTTRNITHFHIPDSAVKLCHRDFGPKSVDVCCMHPFIYLQIIVKAFEPVPETSI
jgi:hypothetical protein